MDDLRVAVELYGASKRLECRGEERDAANIRSALTVLAQYYGFTIEEVISEYVKTALPLRETIHVCR
ncbi:MAG: hypothetical protein K0R57_4112 [Paenibacillaceae bacterium]|jgi:hypothetical protein|nr:hypothetical protein [Paenibacillaceae bacterium]